MDGSLIQIIWSETKKQFVALSPEIPGIYGMGDNAHDATRALQESLARWQALIDELYPQYRLH